MNLEIWHERLRSVIDLEENASGAGAGDVGVIDSQISEIETSLCEICDEIVVNCREDAIDALKISADIVRIEALAPLRPSKLPAILDNVIAWL